MDQVPAKFVRMPYGYAVPVKIAKTINLLHRHGFISERGTESELFITQKYLVLSGNYQKLDDKLRPSTNIRLISTEEEDNLSDYEIFLTSQEGGHSLPILLEPQSKYGYSRYKELNLSIIEGEVYPIVRVIKKTEIKERVKTEIKEERSRPK